MSLVNNREEFEKIILSFKGNNADTISNFPLDKRMIYDFISQKRMKYIIQNSGCLFLIDEGNYDDLYYLIKKGTLINLSGNKRNILINDSLIVKEVFNREENINNLYINSGFKLESVNYLLLLDIDKKLSDLNKKLEICKPIIDYRIINSDIKKYDIHEAKKIWKENLKETDIPLDHYHFGNLIALIHDNRIIAVAWYDLNKRGDLEWRHIVVDKQFRGMGLSKFLFYNCLKITVKDGVKRAVTWVESENYVSLEMHRSIGFVKTNRVSAQYVLKY